MNDYNTWFDLPEKQKELKESLPATLDLLNEAIRKLAKVTWKVYEGIISSIFICNELEEIFNMVALCRLWTSNNSSRLDLLLKLSQNNLQYAHHMCSTLSSTTPDTLDSSLRLLYAYLGDAAINTGYAVVIMDNTLMRMGEKRYESSISKAPSTKEHETKPARDCIGSSCKRRSDCFYRDERLL